MGKKSTKERRGEAKLVKVVAERRADGREIRRVEDGRDIADVSCCEALLHDLASWCVLCCC
eukprot:SAG22_NODE_275_length_13171_cov_11.640606_10_plen_61_part_00